MTPAALPLSAAQRHAFDFLLSRQSAWPLVAPAPSQAELDLVLATALRAPDHGQLQPWRFVLIQGEARQALGEVFVQAARARDAGSDAERMRAKALSAPLLIAMAAQVRKGHKVPESEQVLAAAAAAMNLLNALHILGYGGFWATGLNSHDNNVKQALGLRHTDTLIGFLYVGTPKEPARSVSRSQPAAFVRDWQPEGVVAAQE